MGVKESLRKNFPGIFGAYHYIWAGTGAKLRGSPSKKLFVIGVTGTKGKTTTLELINAILEAAGKRTALLSSLRVKIADTDKKNNLGNSMPGHGYIQRFLRNAVREKCAYALIEVTSQGVVAHRHRFVDWNIGVLTNLAPEHIESHGSFENYRNAKLGFLKYVLEHGGKVFLNRDDKHFGFFTESLSSHNPIEYSRQDERLRSYFPKVGPMRSVTDGPTPKFLLSEFNEENVAVAVAVTKELGIGDAQIKMALENFRGVQGRMEFVVVGGYTAIVDYAHTPDSLLAAYRAAKPRATVHYPKPKLVCVLGSAGGGRDRWKRPAMGKIAAENCDEIILSNEDPYDEDPHEILSEIKAGISEANFPAAHVHEVLDRREAIKKAVELMRPGDVVIGTGKGSEDWIHLANGKRIPWSEKVIFEETLRLRERG